MLVRASQKQEPAGPSSWQGVTDSQMAEHDSVTGEATAPGRNSFGKLYDLVGSLYEAGPETKQRMLEQLQPSQRCALKLQKGKSACISRIAYLLFESTSESMLSQIHLGGYARAGAA